MKLKFFTAALASIAVLGVGIIAAEVAPPPQTRTAFIGTFTNDPGAGIYSCLYNPATGELSDIRLELEAVQSSFLTLSANRKILYTFRTNEDGLTSFLSFRIGKDKRTLIPIDSIAMGTKDPCHIKLLDGGRILAAACYGDGKVAWCNVDRRGKFIGGVKLIDHGKGSRAHQVNSHGRYVYVPDLGLDRVVVYRIENSGLVYDSHIPVPAGSGPRHCTFAPAGERMALVCEVSSTAMIFGPDERGIFSRQLQTISTLPPVNNPAERDYRHAAADIHYLPDGSLLWASERGFPSLVCYNVDPITGLVSLAGSITEGIDWPRGFDVDGKWLLVCNQEGNNVATYHAGAPASDKKTAPVSTVAAFKPSCVVVLTR